MVGLNFVSGRVSLKYTNSFCRRLIKKRNKLQKEFISNNKWIIGNINLKFFNKPEEV